MKKLRPVSLQLYGAVRGSPVRAVRTPSLWSVPTAQYNLLCLEAPCRRLGGSTVQARVRQIGPSDPIWEGGENSTQTGAPARGSNTSLGPADRMPNKKAARSLRGFYGSRPRPRPPSPCQSCWQQASVRPRHPGRGGQGLDLGSSPSRRAPSSRGLRPDVHRQC